MKTIRFFIIAIASALLFSACNVQPGEVKQTSEQVGIVGTDRFISSLSSAKPIGIKSEEITDEEARVMIEPVMILSKAYLKANEYDFTEDFDDPDDPRIAIVALALAEYDRTYGVATKTSFGGCVLEAIGIGDLLHAGGKKLAKVIAKQVIKKAIPYVGAALAVGDFVLCMLD
ncbi:MAG: hypothetical protein IKQ76_03005 [Bacteroidales bacterium]|nr:hypothetical protein [Bacteroidales bacterium]